MMGNIYTYFDEVFESKQDLFTFISTELEEKGVVKQSFRKSIEEREKKYPTGLKLQGMNVAIIHTDIEHSLQEALCVIKLAHPIEFVNAENMEPLDVDFIIGLVFVDGNLHIEMLKKIALLLQDRVVIQRMKSTTSNVELEILMNEYFGGRDEKTIR